MFRFVVLAMFLAVSSAFMAPAMPSKMTQSKISMHGGKGFGGKGGGKSRAGGKGGGKGKGRGNGGWAFGKRPRE